jgi:hypothetical protein
MAKNRFKNSMNEEINEIGMIRDIIEENNANDKITTPPQHDMNKSKSQPKQKKRVKFQ